MIILTEPRANEEAINYIKSKAPVNQRVFYRMLPDIQARAFTVSGINNADVLQAVRDRIADLPAGADWKEVRDDIFQQISPWLVDDKADAKERERQVAAAYRRAELLLRTHGFQAYAATHHSLQVEQMDVFPWWQYQTMEDGKVRPDHAALNGIVLPASSPFWRDHYPPWDWGCRCEVIALSDDDVAEIQRADGARDPADAQVLGPEARRRLENDGELTRANVELIDPNDPDRKTIIERIPGGKFDVKSPLEKAQTHKEKLSAYVWDPGSLQLPIDRIAERYDDDIWNLFYDQMRSAKLAVGSKTVWDWLFKPYVDDAVRDHYSVARTNEMAVILNHRTGATIAKVAGNTDRVVLKRQLDNARENGERIVIMHNHPGETGPSPIDLHVMVRNRDTLAEVYTITSGSVYRVQITGNMSNQVADNLAARLLDVKDDATGWTKLFGRLAKNGVLSYEKVTR